jgi:hypothetical protein
MEAVDVSETAENYTSVTCHIQILLLVRAIVLPRYRGQEKNKEP